MTPNDEPQFKTVTRPCVQCKAWNPIGLTQDRLPYAYVCVRCGHVTVYTKERARRCC